MWSHHGPEWRPARLPSATPTTTERPPDNYQTGRRQENATHATTANAAAEINEARATNPDRASLLRHACSPLRWHQTCDFRERATSAPTELGGEICNVAKSSPYAGPSAGTEVARLRKWHVWCLLGESGRLAAVSLARWRRGGV